MVTLAEIRDGYNRLNTRLIRGGGALAANLYRQLGSWRDEDYERYLAVLQPQLEGLKVQAANLQAAYYQEVARANGEAFTPAPVQSSQLTDTNLRNGVDFSTVYRRPFVETWTALASGTLVTPSIERGATRAFQIASGDIQLASREAGLRQRQNNNNIVGYRRVLTGAENCALCAIASTQRYTRNQLKPIHPGCDCGEEPIYGDFDPGQVIDPEGLDSIHEALREQLGVSDRGARAAEIGKFVEYEEGGTRLADFTEIIVTREHGEYGPTLAWRNQHFTGPADIPGVLDTNI
jgi:hypothetical protein